MQNKTDANTDTVMHHNKRMSHSTLYSILRLGATTRMLITVYSICNHSWMQKREFTINTQNGHKRKNVCYPLPEMQV